ncbi:hypothetical protein Drorol1_Dr00021300 [Drosera rotundifolia]
MPFRQPDYFKEVLQSPGFPMKESLSIVVSWPPFGIGSISTEGAAPPPVADPMVPSTPASSPEDPAAIAGPVEVAQGTSDDAENDEMHEQVLLKDLEEMGFTE